MKSMDSAAPPANVYEGSGRVVALPTPGALGDHTGARATLHYGVRVVMAPISDQGKGESRPAVR